MNDRSLAREQPLCWENVRAFRVGTCWLHAIVPADHQVGSRQGRPFRSPPFAARGFGHGGVPAAVTLPRVLATAEPVAPAEWGAHDLVRLAAVFETFVAGAAIRRATMAASLLSRVADPEDVRALRLALRALDSRAANALLGRGAVRLRDLSADRREAVLVSWATSRLSGRRTAFQTLKRLACFFAYADPGPAGVVNPLWARIGYVPIEEPVTPDAPAIRPHEFSDGPAAAVTLDADVAIVGSGAGGGVAAAALAAAGRDVIVIESGSYVPEAGMSPGELDGFDRLYLDHGLTATSDLGIAILAGSTLGGGTVVNWATCFAPPDWLRAEWTAEHGLEGFDGSETASDVADLRAELAFAPPPGIPPKDRAILEGASALGWATAPVLRDADGCGDCGACGFGCRRGAKRSGPRVHLAKAARYGARFLVRARAERLLFEQGKVAGLTGEVERADGSLISFTVGARQVVVAAGALRTPALFVASGIGHPALGSNLRLHPVAVVAGRMPWPVEMWRGTMQAASSNQFCAPPAQRTPRGRAGARRFHHRIGPGAPGSHRAGVAVGGRGGPRGPDDAHAYLHPAHRDRPRRWFRPRRHVPLGTCPHRLQDRRRRRAVGAPCARGDGASRACRWGAGGSGARNARRLVRCRSARCRRARGMPTSGSSPRSTSRPTGASSSRCTRWARRARDRTRAPAPATRGAAFDRHVLAGRCAGCTSPTRPCSRPHPGSTRWSR